MHTASKLTVICAAALSFILTSCASAPVKPPIHPVEEVYPTLPATTLRHEITHVVGPGETLWRISKMYDVDMEIIMRANQLKDAATLEMGQKLIIPAAAPLRPVISLYRSNKWKYIVIHHSATDEGNALAFFKSHLKRGFSGGLGYHFVISNGSYGKDDGQIEVSPRWIKQQDGAHCKAGGMNHIGIGICLVGNFNKEKISPKQMDSLLYLVSILKKYYRIPLKNVIGHRQAPGANTECPGGNFPWEAFKKRLKEME